MSYKCDERRARSLARAREIKIDSCRRRRYESELVLANLLPPPLGRFEGG